jgi:putative hemolysin
MTTTSLLVVSVVLVAILTAVATAVRSVSRIWLRHWVERRLSGAPTAELYLERPQRLILAATTAVAMLVFLAGTVIATSTTEPWVRVRGTVTYALALLIAGQLVPRAIARRWPSALIPPLIPVLRLLEFLLWPLLFVVRRLTGEARRDAGDVKTEDEALGELLREGELEGVGEHTEIAIIEGVVNFGERTVSEVMTQRRDIFAVDAALDVGALGRQLAQGGFSRVPVYTGSLDQIAGFVHAFDVIQAVDEAPQLRPVGLATPSLRCNDLLFRMLRERKHLAIVQGPAGETLGLVTLEDLLEELVGEIRDEHDDPDVAPRRPEGDLGA